MIAMRLALTTGFFALAGASFLVTDSLLTRAPAPAPAPMAGATAGPVRAAAPPKRSALSTIQTALLGQPSGPEPTDDMVALLPNPWSRFHEEMLRDPGGTSYVRKELAKRFRKAARICAQQGGFVPADQAELDFRAEVRMDGQQIQITDASFAGVRSETPMSPAVQACITQQTQQLVGTGITSMLRGLSYNGPVPFMVMLSAGECRPPA